jgi:hypothetical protein
MKLLIDPVKKLKVTGSKISHIDKVKPRSRDMSVSKIFEAIWLACERASGI